MGNDTDNGTQPIASMTQSDAPAFRRATMRKALTDESWWEQRAPFIGASTAGVLFGEHPFLTLGQLARERRTGARQPDNAAMMRGRFLEDGVARLVGARERG